MRVHSERKLFLFGRYSLALLLPKKWLGELGVERGEEVRLELDRKRKRIVIRFSNNTEPVSRTRKLKTNKNNPGWQPIPQL